MRAALFASLTSACLAARAVLDLEVSLEPWQRKYCLLHAKKLPRDPKGQNDVSTYVAVALSDEECDVLIQQKLADCEAFDALDDGKKPFSGHSCKEFRTQVALIHEQLAAKHNVDLGLAAKACEAALFQVCEASIGPTWCALGANKDHECTPAGVCSVAGEHLWGAGEWNCQPTESWAACVGRTRAELNAKGQLTAVQALMREQVLKCICVSKQIDNAHCYGDEGNKVALHAGEKWCQWDRTQEWTVMKERALDEYKQLWQPECEEFPYHVVEEE